jgi:hypothetical protein
MCVVYHPLKATDHEHMNLLLFTHLPRKTSVIDQVKVKGGGSGDQRGGREHQDAVNTLNTLSTLIIRFT